ncbi:hypothetical protein C8F01DRAFT_1087732 [Mycena amicta]|nr:hypothetical protein C8F01DRAFT_1087732 [Mycena amicta]
MFAFCRVIPIVTAFFAAAMAVLTSDGVFPAPPDLTIASWMWNNNTLNTGFPAGSSAFRLTFEPIAKIPVANISVAISADNAYSLYLNGTLIGNGLSWPTPNVWTINNVPSTGAWVFAIMATNYADASLNPAGVIASFVASNDALQASYTWYTGQITTPSVVWNAMYPVPEGFASPTFDDSAWPTAVIEAPYGGGPWGAVCICVEQTFMQASASMADFPSAFSKALEVYVSPDCAVRISVNKEIAKFSPHDYREILDPSSNQPTRKAVSKLVEIIKIHRLCVADDSLGADGNANRGNAL